jgi:hypothetical protein
MISSYNQIGSFSQTKADGIDTYAEAKAYPKDSVVVKDKHLYLANGEIAENTTFDIGSSGSTWSPINTKMSTSVTPVYFGYSGSNLVTYNASASISTVKSTAATALKLSDGSIVTSGVVVIPNHGYTPGRQVYLNGTPGQGTYSVLNDNYFSQKLFVALDSDTILVNIGEPDNIQFLSANGVTRSGISSATDLTWSETTAKGLAFTSNTTFKLYAGNVYHISAAFNFGAVASQEYAIISLVNSANSIVNNTSTMYRFGADGLIDAGNLSTVYTAASDSVLKFRVTSVSGSLDLRAQATFCNIARIG